MADGDEIHRSMRYRYQKGLRQVCEGVLTESEIARTFARALGKELDSPIYNYALNELFEATIKLERSVEKSDSGEPVDWAAVRRDLSRCLAGANLNKRVHFVLERACELAATRLQRGERPRSLQEYVVEQFIDQEFRGQVLGKGPAHPDQVCLSQEAIDARLEAVLPLLRPHQRSFAKQVIRQRTFHKLSLAPVPLGLVQSRSLDVYDSIEELFYGSA